MSIVNVPAEELVPSAPMGGDRMVRPEKREDVHETIKHIFADAAKRSLSGASIPGRTSFRS